MCIRDSIAPLQFAHKDAEAFAEFLRSPAGGKVPEIHIKFCLLYTSDAADERSSVDLGGRRIIKKKQSKREEDNATTDK